MGTRFQGPILLRLLVPSGRDPHPHPWESSYTFPPVDMRTVGTTRGQDGDIRRKKREKRRKERLESVRDKKRDLEMKTHLEEIEVEERSRGEDHGRGRNMFGSWRTLGEEEGR